MPGASEHQIGLALDITSDTYTMLDEQFADTEAGKWLAEHSFRVWILRCAILRVRSILPVLNMNRGIFRYVGKEAATIMKEEGICLEEFWDKYL